MSLRNGKYVCDGTCGGIEVGNGSANYATKIIGKDPDSPLEVRDLHLCIEARDGAPFGCTGRALGRGTLAAYYETRNP